MDEHIENFHYPSNIKLDASPLVEAWLDIRWQLEPSNIPGLQQDNAFPFALGIFYEHVKERFPHRLNLGTSNLPEEILPHATRYQFRQGDDNGWPLLQLGPGIATVNFVEPYSWEEFENTILFLREKLLVAYKETGHKTQEVSLRYRNAIPFEQSNGSLFEILETKLNTALNLPQHLLNITDNAGSPSGLQFQTSFPLFESRCTGTIMIATAINKKKTPEGGKEEPMILWELSVKSSGKHVIDVNDKEEFCDWLQKAHAILHEWFFSTIDGPLLEQYKSGGL